MKRLWIIAFLFVCLGASAQQVITATLTVTNIYGTTNGETLTLNGTTWTITNNVQNNVQILYGTNTTLAASNIYTAFFLNPPSKVLLSWPASTNIVTFQCYPGAGLTASINSSPSNWATLTFSTNVASSGTVVVRIPASVEGAPMQTNIGSQLEQYLEVSTNAFPQTNTFAANFVGTTNAQNVTGAKTLTNVAGIWGGIVSNSPAIGGNVWGLTNGYYSNSILVNPTLTNGVNYGNAFSSPGTAGGAEQFGIGASAAGSFATAVGDGASAPSNSASAFGNGATAGWVQSTAIGNAAKANGVGAVALGLSAIASANYSSALGTFANTANFSNSTAIGYISTNSANNQVMLGAGGIQVVVNSNLAVYAGGATITGAVSMVSGGLTITGGAVTNIWHSGTNTFLAGADIAFTRYPISSLANGNNAGVIVGTNVFCDVSGPSGAFTINGINGSPNRDGKVVIIKNATGQTMTIANESGVDAVAGNRIRTGFSADQSYTNNPGIVTLIYDGSLSRWIIQSHN